MPEPLDDVAVLRAAGREFFRAAAPLPVLRQWIGQPAGFDRGLWQRMAREFGAQSIAIAEEHGGQGFGPAELAIVSEVVGGVLLRAPFGPSAVTSTLLISAIGSAHDRAELLPRLASGELAATTALAGEDLAGGLDSAGTVTSDLHPDGSAAITGEVTMVAFGASADLVLVPALLPAGYGSRHGVFVVDPRSAGVGITPLDRLDLTSEYAALRFQEAPARLLGRGTDPARWHEHFGTAVEHTRICLAAELVGAARECLDLAVAYVKTREQFGRPVGQFQAVQHKCADLYVEIELASAAVDYARGCMGATGRALAEAAALAKGAASDMGAGVAAECLHLFGGIGFTWEHDAHLFLRRAKSSSMLLGDTAYHAERLLRMRLSQR